MEHLLTSISKPAGLEFLIRDNIGFGCAHLTSNFTEKAAINNLETAFENGITHFDTARLYGYGLAERMLGKFARNKRDKISISTKAGLFPTTPMLKNLFLQNAARSIYRVAKNRLGSASIQQLAGQAVSKRLNITDLKTSLQTSLKELQTDYVDYFFLHEAVIEDANSMELIDFLQKQKASGYIRSFGVASYNNTINDVRLLARDYSVLQTDNSFPFVLPESITSSNQFSNRFYFSPFLHLQAIKGLLENDHVFAREIPGLLDCDVRQLPLDLCLMHQLETDQNGVMLFSSTKSKKIIQTIQRWSYLKRSSPDQLYHFSTVRKMVIKKLFHPKTN